MQNTPLSNRDPLAMYHPADRIMSCPPWHSSRMADLQAINAFLISARDRKPTQAPTRERSLQIFGDEKRLDDLRKGKTGLFEGRISLEDLLCYPVAPPLPCEMPPQRPYGRPVLVLENYHSYDSFCRWNRQAALYAAIACGAGNAFRQGADNLDDLIAATAARLKDGRHCDLIAVFTDGCLSTAAVALWKRHPQTVSTPASPVCFLAKSQPGSSTCGPQATASLRKASVWNSFSETTRPSPRPTPPEPGVDHPRADRLPTRRGRAKAAVRRTRSPLHAVPAPRSRWRRRRCCASRHRRSEFSSPLRRTWDPRSRSSVPRTP